MVVMFDKETGDRLLVLGWWQVDCCTLPVLQGGQFAKMSCQVEDGVGEEERRSKIRRIWLRDKGEEEREWSHGSGERWEEGSGFLFYNTYFTYITKFMHYE